MPMSENLITELIAVLQNDNHDIQQESAIALIELGPEAVPEVIRALNTPNDQVRYWAA